MRIEEGGGGNILSIYRVFYVSKYFLYTNIRTYICIWYATISKKKAWFITNSKSSWTIN